MARNPKDLPSIARQRQETVSTGAAQ